MSIAEKFEVIADAVYEKGELMGYENGRNEGLEEGYASGVIEGKEAEYNTFWETYQNKGNQTNYMYIHILTTSLFGCSIYNSL